MQFAAPAQFGPARRSAQNGDISLDISMLIVLRIFFPTTRAMG
jgi:hypothetical protein